MRVGVGDSFSEFPRRPSPHQRLCAAENDDLLLARDIRAMIILIFTLVSAVNQVTSMAVFFHVTFDFLGTYCI